MSELEENIKQLTKEERSIIIKINAKKLKLT